MNHDEYLLALQLLAEERYGTKVRGARHGEDEGERALREALG